jgi:hypothetical protein
MSDLKRTVLWLLVLLAPGGVLLVPVLLFHVGKGGLCRSLAGRAQGTASASA